MESWQVGLLVLAAVWVGATIPALLQLRATLRAAEVAIRTVAPRVEAGLSELEDAGRKVSGVVDGLQSSTRVLTAIGVAVGPAIVAGLGSYRAARAESKEEEAHEQRARIDD